MISLEITPDLDRNRFQLVGLLVDMMYPISLHSSMYVSGFSLARIQAQHFSFSDDSKASHSMGPGIDLPQDNPRH
jgi:hypothetical protein